VVAPGSADLTSRNFTSAMPKSRRRACLQLYRGLGIRRLFLFLLLVLLSLATVSCLSLKRGFTCWYMGNIWPTFPQGWTTLEHLQAVIPSILIGLLIALGAILIAPSIFFGCQISRLLFQTVFTLLSWERVSCLIFGEALFIRPNGFIRYNWSFGG